MDFNAQKEAMITEVVSQVTEQVTSNKDANNVLELINDTIYYERERLRTHGHLYNNAETEKKFFYTLGKRLSDISEKESRKRLNQIIEHYTKEVAGNFDPLTYKLATGAIPTLTTLLLNTLSPARIIKNFPAIPSIDQTVIVQGNIKRIKKLVESGGVIVYTPQHLSNLDSPIIGLSIYRQSLPPVLYGAGLNLFQLPLFHFFMNRLGAYRVDRLKKAGLYKKVLKMFAQITLENKFHHLFFPGGTRIRSGGIETKLKKGLLGVPLQAFVSSKLKGKNIKFYIVPITLSYQLTLEAETLINDHLQQTGKSRYIITDDESSKPAAIFNFVKQLISLEGKVFLTFADPLDPFGNKVNDKGISIDNKGREINIDGYITKNNEVKIDQQRDKVYTDELEKQIIQAFHNNTVITITHIVAYVLYKLLWKKSKTHDLFKFLRQTATNISIPMEDSEKELATLVLKLKKLEANNKLRLEPTIYDKDPADIIMKALKYFGVFHKAPVILRKGNRLFTRDANLLYYYHNRLAAYNLGGEE